MKTITYLCLLMAFSACSKSEPDNNNNPVISPETFVQFTIKSGEHYCDKSSIQPVSLTEMKFKVKFDSSAIYQTKEPANQNDINKLYGFSEGIDNHVNSARIGWNWNKAELHLYAYTYVNSVRDSKEIAVVAIGAETDCAIRVSGNEYIFTVENKTVSMPRALNTSMVSGYKQYPYFGGDEVAPNDIQIYIRDLK